MLNLLLHLQFFKYNVTWLLTLLFLRRVPATNEGFYIYDFN